MVLRLGEEGGEGGGGGEVGVPGGAALGSEDPLLDAVDRLPVVLHFGKDFHHQGRRLDGALVPAVAAGVAVPVHARLVADMGRLSDAGGEADGLGSVAHIEEEEGGLSLGIEGSQVGVVHLEIAQVEAVGLLREAVALREGLNVMVETAGVEQREAVVEGLCVPVLLHEQFVEVAHGPEILAALVVERGAGGEALEDALGDITAGRLPGGHPAPSAL